jgi:hypothetical protein
MGKVRVGEAIGASFRFVGEAWTKAWGVMLLLVVVACAAQVAEASNPGAPLIPLLSAPVALFVTTAAAGALYRLRFAGDHPGDPAFAAGPAGFRWTGLEWRVMGANLLVGLLIAVLLFVVFIIWAIALGAIIGSSPPELDSIENGSQAEKTAALLRLMAGPVGVVSAVILIPTLLGLFYLGVRLILFTPMAAETGSFDFAKAWTLARGAMLALILGAILIYFVEALLGFAVGASSQFVATKLGAAASGRTWANIIGQTLSATINTPLLAGLVLYVYRTQRGDQSVAATFS